MKKMMIIGGGVFALLLAAGGGAFFLMKGEEPAVAEAAEPEIAAARDVFYYDIHPEFVVNFRGKSRVKFMMVEMSVATYDEKVTTIIDDHMPELRNDLLMVLAEQDSASLNTMEGKTALREQAMATIDAVVSNYYKADSVKDVYLTRLVMQ